MRAGDSSAGPPAGPPEADWCPPESDTMQVRLGADEGHIRQRRIVNRLRGWDGFIELSFIVFGLRFEPLGFGRK